MDYDAPANTQLDKQVEEIAYNAGGGRLNPVRESRRQRLLRHKRELQAQLAVVQKALNALDAHPELEEFMETIAQAGV